MDEKKRNLKGSEKRDIFKRRHKDLDSSFYATDADFCLVSKYPPGTVAYLDYKDLGDNVTFTEAIQYNEWITHAPVYIVQGSDPDNGPFTIMRYLGGDWEPKPPDVTLEFVTQVEDWHSFGVWEAGLRQEYSKRRGWNGNLRTNDA
ncbi:MAG: hypothetical protein PVJ86_05420 [Phycisphaerales bacterium]|jgi:hypothetical protein